MEQDEADQNGTIRSEIAIGPRTGMYVDSHNTFCCIESKCKCAFQKVEL